jgi:hypothetical protein
MIPWTYHSIRFLYQTKEMKRNPRSNSRITIFYLTLSHFLFLEQESHFVYFVREKKMKVSEAIKCYVEGIMLSNEDYSNGPQAFKRRYQEIYLILNEDKHQSMPT